MKCLLIGGENDGMRVEIPPYMPQMMRWPVMQSLPNSSSLREEKGTTAISHTETYRLERFREGGKEFIVYVSDAIKPGEMFQVLLDGYRGKNDWR